MEQLKVRFIQRLILDLVYPVSLLRQVAVHRGKDLLKMLMNLARWLSKSQRVCERSKILISRVDSVEV